MALPHNAFEALRKVFEAPRPVLRWTAACLVALLAFPAGGYETDQYSNRLQPLEDSTELLNEKVNRELQRVVERWSGERDEEAVATAVWRRLGGVHWVDRIERFAVRSPEVDKLPQWRRRSIYRDVSFKASRVTRFFGVGRTFRLAGTRVGSDKLGHFFSQGRKYHRRYLFHGSEEKTLRRGAFAERWIFGAAFTGTYSNADIVANFEGYRFYRSLFEEMTPTGSAEPRPAIFRWERNRLVFQRSFDWSDHVNDYWDEALNPSFYLKSMAREMEVILRGLCPEYRSRPEAFLPRRDEALRRAYGAIGQRPAPRFRMDRICAGEQELAEELPGPP